MSADSRFLGLGFVRYKNSRNILVKCVVVPVLGFMRLSILGHGLAVG